MGLYKQVIRGFNDKVGGIGVPKVRYRTKRRYGHPTRVILSRLPSISITPNLPTLNQWASGLGIIKPKRRRHLWAKEPQPLML